MRLSEVKHQLKDLSKLFFELPDGSLVPSHFHVTEVGHIHKHFIDCGGTVRQEDAISFQLWYATDYNHQLHPDKLMHIIELSERTLGLKDLEIEVEYQGDSIQKYGLEFHKDRFLLTTKHTDCLAKEACGIPVAKKKVRLSDLQQEPCCNSEGNCC